MQGLMSAALAVECDLQRMALDCILAMTIRPDLLGILLQRMANLNAAWREALEDSGIAPDSMAKITAPIRHPLLQSLLDTAPPPDPEAVREGKELLERGIERAGTP